MQESKAASDVGGMSCKSRWGYSCHHQTHWPAFSAIVYTVSPPCTRSEHWCGPPPSFPGSGNVWRGMLSGEPLEQTPLFYLLCSWQISGATVLGFLSILSSGTRAAALLALCPPTKSISGPRKASGHPQSLLSSVGTGWGKRSAVLVLQRLGCRSMKCQCGGQKTLFGACSLAQPRPTEWPLSGINYYWFPVLSSKPCLYVPPFTAWSRREVRSRILAPWFPNMYISTCV